MGEQPRQSDVFRVIASQWREMTPEQKAPYVEEVPNFALFVVGAQGPRSLQVGDATVPQAAS